MRSNSCVRAGVESAESKGKGPSSMTRLSLSPHPHSPRGPIDRIGAEVQRGREERFVVRYLVEGNIGAVSLPALVSPARTDGLWRQTCFEAFIAPSSGKGYFEFNFSPSTEWAAYRFSAYREGMCDALECPAPTISINKDERAFELTATLDLNWIGASVPWRLGLSAIVVDAKGDKSYWALAHPDGKPDFHHPAGLSAIIEKDLIR